MFLYKHKDRHIVVSNSDKNDVGEVQVGWVSLVEGVDGMARRGRRPTYRKAVPSSELMPLDVADVSVRVRQLAEDVAEGMMLAEAAPEGTSQD